MLELNMSIAIIGEQLNCLDIFESIGAWNCKTCFFLRFWQEMLLNIYTALESQAVNFRSWGAPGMSLINSFFFI